MPRHAAPKLEGMTVSQLLQLRDKVQTALSSKIELERDELQRKINELSNLVSPAAGNGRSEIRLARGGRRAVGKRAGNGKTHPLKGRTVAPKYRDMANSDQTWAGRGQAPRWLTAYESQGRKRDEFLIGATAGARGKGRKSKQA
jgi:DNA-binding protein H-NS